MDNYEKQHAAFHNDFEQNLFHLLSKNC